MFVWDSKEILLLPIAETTATLCLKIFRSSGLFQICSENCGFSNFRTSWGNNIKQQFGATEYLSKLFLASRKARPELIVVSDLRFCVEYSWYLLVIGDSSFIVGRFFFVGSNKSTFDLPRNLLLMLQKSGKLTS